MRLQGDPWAERQEEATLGDWRVTRAPDRGSFSQLTDDVCTYVQNQAPLSPVSHKSLSKISLCFCFLGEEVGGGRNEGGGGLPLPGL